MPTTYFDGRKLREIDLVNLFLASEGQISQYYGRIGSGKTYSGTADVLDLLSRGEVVYVNWPIHYKGFDQRKDLAYVFMSLVFFWRDRFYEFPKENLRYLKIDENFHDTFEKITDAHVFLDEGHVVFDSYEMAKMSIKRRMSVLHTRHFNRSIHIISQRPTAIHVTMRANVNVFYKCQKALHIGPLLLFKRTEFQDMTGETVDESDPVSVKWYWGNKKVMNAYDSQYLRGDTPQSQKLFVNGYEFTYGERLTKFYKMAIHTLSPTLQKIWGRVYNKRNDSKKHTVQLVQKRTKIRKANTQVLEKARKENTGSESEIKKINIKHI